MMGRWAKCGGYRAFRLAYSMEKMYNRMDMAKTYNATFLKRDRWWVAWSEDVPGALTQGKTLSRRHSGRS